MIAGESPDWLPPGFTVKVKYRNGRKIKYYLNVATGAKYYTKKDVIQCTAAINDGHGTPQTMKQGVNGLSSSEKGETTLVKADDSSELLPSGWELEEKVRHKGVRKGSVYKVYIELSSGRKFYSRDAVARYLKTVDHANTITAENKVDNAAIPSPETPQGTPKTNRGSISKKKPTDSSFKMVAVEITVDDDLPPGWIKEIRTSKSGHRIRKDPFYIDPVSGYVFRSKKDALRYLKTNDISKCAIRPLKRALYDPKKNHIPTSNPATEKSYNDTRQLFLGEESIDGREPSGTKGVAESEADDALKRAPDINVPESVKVTCVGVDSQEENATEMNNNHQASKDEDLKTMTVDATICSPVIDPLPTKQELLGNGTEKQAEKTQVGTKRSKKRGGLSLPSRSSKRLAGCEPEMLSDMDTSKSSVGAAVRRSLENDVDMSPFPSMKEASASVPLPPNLEPEKETADKETLLETELVDEVEMPKSEEPAAPEDQAGTEKQLDGRNEESQELQFFSEFGESWSDPTLEFAIKTLRGEIPIEETLKFTGCFDGQLNIHNLADGGMKSLQPDAPINFQNELLPGSESFKQPGTVNQMPVNSLSFFATQMPANSSCFSAPGNISSVPCNGSNGQSSTDPGEKGLPHKP